MNSRGRIRATIKHQPTDRIPIDMGSANCTGININAYINLKKYLNILPDALPRMHDWGQQLAYPDAEILDRLGVDCPQIINRE